MRHFWMRWTSVLLAAVVVAPMLVACGPQSPQGQSTKSLSLTIALAGDADFIDPHLSTSIGFVPIENAYESLVYTDRDKTSLAPMLAESWTVAPDGLRYTFKIRQGVKFQDGAELDANAVKTSFERLQKINKGPAFVLAGVESMSVPEKHTFDVTLKPGGAPFLQGLVRVQIVSPKAIAEKAVGDDLAQDYLNRMSAGTGPYQVTEWQRSQKIVLKRFEGYWRGWKDPNAFTDVTMLVVPEPTTQQQMLQKGEVDMAFNLPTDAPRTLANTPDLQVVTAPGLRVLYFLLNYSAPPTNDVRVRQALNYAFDSESFSKATGTYDPPVGPVPLLFLNGKPNFPYKFDIEKAKALLRDAGYSETKKVKLIADVLINNPDQQRASEILQAGLQKTGLVDIELRPGDFNATRSYNVGWQKTKDPATARHLFGLFTPPRMPDPYAYLWYVFHTAAGGGFANNVMSYFNPKFDALIDDASRQLDAGKRQATYLQATQLIIDDAAAVFIGTQTKNYVLRKDVKGFFIHPTWYPHVLVYSLSRG